MNDTPCRVTYDLNRYMAEKPERKPTQSDRDQAIEEKADELHASWVEGNLPESLVEFASEQLLDLMYLVREGETNPTEIGNKFWEIYTESLNELAVKQAEEWECQQ